MRAPSCLSFSSAWTSGVDSRGGRRAMTHAIGSPTSRIGSVRIAAAVPPLAQCASSMEIRSGQPPGPARSKSCCRSSAARTVARGAHGERRARCRRAGARLRRRAPPTAPRAPRPSRLASRRAATDPDAEAAGDRRHLCEQAALSHTSGAFDDEHRFGAVGKAFELGLNQREFRVAPAHTSCVVLRRHRSSRRAYPSASDGFQSHDRVMPAGASPATLALPHSEEESTVNGRPTSSGPWRRADGSCWSGVIERLQTEGFQVRAPQFPLSSLADDVTRLRQVLEFQEGP